MEKGLRVGEFIISLIVLIGMGVGAWVNIRTTVAQQQVEIENLKSFQNKIDGKQDEILKSISEIRVLIETKQDRDAKNIK